MSSIILIVNIVLFVFMALSILLGLIRNFKSNLCSLIAVIVVAILTFALSGVIASALQGIEIGGQTIQALIETALAESLELENLNSTVLSEYASSISFTVWHIVSFIGLLVVGFIAIGPLLKLILKLVIPLSNQKTTNVGLKIAGVAISFVSFMICITLITAPIFGLTQIVEEVAVEFEEQNQEVSIDNEISEVLSEVNNGPFVKFMKVYSGKDLGLQKSILNSMTQIETKYGKIEIVGEMDKYMELIKVAVCFVEDSDNLYQTLLDNKEQLFSTLKDTESISSIMPAIIEIIRISGDLEINYFDELDWSKETINFIEVFESLVNSLDELSFDPNNPTNVLGNTGLPSALQELGYEMQDSKIMTDIILDILNSYLIEALSKEAPETLQDLFEILDLTQMNLSNDFYILGQIFNVVYSIGLDENSSINYLDKIDEIGSLIDLPFKLSTIQGNELVVVETLLEFTGLNTILAENNFELDFQGQDIPTEITHIKNAIVKLLYLCKENNVDLDNLNIQQLLQDVLNSENESSKTLLDEFLDASFSSNTLTNTFISFISNLFNEFGAEWKSQEFKAIEEDITNLNKEEFKESTLIILELINEIESFESLDFLNMNSETLLKYENVLLDLSACSIITLDPILSYLESGINSGLNIEIDLLDTINDEDNSGSNVNEWQAEISNLFDILGYFSGVSIDTSSLSTSANNIGSGLDLMKESLIFGNDLNNDGTLTTNDNVFNQIIVGFLDQFGLVSPNNPNGFITLEQANSEDWNTYNWVNELSALAIFDINASTQNTDILSEIQESKIIIKYFDIAGLINEKVENVEFNQGEIHIKLSDYINGGEPFTNDDLVTLDWGYEAENIDTLVSSFEATSPANLISNLENLSTYEPNSIAGKVASDILETLGI